jgi:hypothetical protein
VEKFIDAVFSVAMGYNSESQLAPLIDIDPSQEKTLFRRLGMKNEWRLNATRFLD